MAIVRVETDAEKILTGQRNNIAWLLVTAIITVFLAMVAST